MSTPHSRVTASRHSTPAPTGQEEMRRNVPPMIATDAFSNDPLSPLHHKYGALVTEIASRSEPLAAVLNRHGITQTQWAKLKDMPAFKAALARQAKTFGAIDDLPTRIKLKAQLLTEMLLDEMFDIARHVAYPASARVSAFAQIKNLTGLEKPEDAAPQRAVNLTINLANGRTKTAQAVTIEAVKERDAIAADERYLLSTAGEGLNGDDGAYSAGSTDADPDGGTDADLASELEAATVYSELTEDEPEPEQPATFDRSWNSFGRVQASAIGNRPSFANEAAREIAGASGGSAGDEAGSDGHEDGSAPSFEPAQPAQPSKPVQSFRQRLSALQAAKSSNY